MAAKREMKRAEEAKDAQANELIKRKAGKDTQETVEKLKLKEAEKVAAQAKKDKLDDARQRKEILEQIKRDKEERAQRAAREKALREGKVEIGPQSQKDLNYESHTDSLLSATAASIPTPATIATNITATGDYKDTRLKICHSGKMFETSLPSDRRTYLHRVVLYWLLT